MKTTLHVVFVLPDLPLSGTATRVVHLARDLAQGGDEVTVLVLVDRIANVLADELAASGVALTTRVDRLGRGTVHGRRPVQPAPSRTVVHAAMPTAAVVGWGLARHIGAPWVYSVTNALHVDRPFRRATPRDRVKAVLEWLAIERADAVHAVAPGVAAQIVRRHPRATARLHTVVHQPTPPQAVGAITAVPASAYPRLLCLGRLLGHKRVEDAVAATALLRTVFPEVHLAVVGTGPRLDELRHLVAVGGLERHVSVLGETTGPAAYFSWADVLVHPSLHEGSPRVVAEARACGVPVVCAATAHSPTGDDVHLARPLDPVALRDAVVRAADASPRPSAPGASTLGSARELRGIYQGLVRRSPTAAVPAPAPHQ